MKRFRSSIRSEKREAKTPPRARATPSATPSRRRRRGAAGRGGAPPRRGRSTRPTGSTQRARSSPARWRTTTPPRARSDTALPDDAVAAEELRGRTAADGLDHEDEHGPGSDDAVRDAPGREAPRPAALDPRQHERRRERCDDECDRLRARQERDEAEHEQHDWLRAVGRSSATTSASASHANSG